MRITLEVLNTENIGDITANDMDNIREIFEALVTTGSLTRVKSGQTIIHFDDKGVFKRVEIRYSPWIRKSKKVV
jgi:hypothetical protein